MDDSSKKTLSSIPLLKTKAGPRDKDLWPQRLKEEYQSLIQVNTICITSIKFMNIFIKQYHVRLMPIFKLHVIPLTAKGQFHRLAYLQRSPPRADLIDPCILCEKRHGPIRSAFRVYFYVLYSKCC